MPPRLAAAARTASDALLDWAAAARWRALLLVTLTALLAFLPAQTSLPPTDRDEGRYVMATRQMVASGDYIDIRNQELPRHKQPAGIYWLQAAAVHASGQGEAAGIGIYRLPSLLGATLAAMLAFWAFLPVVGARAALLGALLTASTLLLGVEARIAKTDAVLLATSLAGLGVLLRAFLDPAAVRAGRLPWLFWGALGAGAMVKGPIVALVLLAALLGLCVVGRSARWLGALRPWPGLLLALAIALPWYVAIAIRTEGAFFETALGWNALGKVADGHQGHGAPPGFHTLHVWITFWPAAPLLAALLPWIWGARRRREVQVLLALVLPLWLVFEAVATKLPHYVLPAYPALAALVALALTEVATAARGAWSRLVLHGFWALPLALLLGGGGVFLWFEGWLPVGPAALLLGAVGLGALAAAVARQAAAAVVPLAVATALTAWAGAWPMLARFDELWLSPRMAEAWRDAPGCPAGPLALAGYHEPSLVFLTRTDARLTDGAGAAEFLAGPGGCRLAFVDAAPGRRGRPAQAIAFAARAAELGLAPERLAVVEGRNMNGGHPRRMELWRVRGGA